MSKKILISPDHGAGWSTWIGSSKEERDFALFDEALIQAVESGNTDAINTAVLDFEKRFEERFKDAPYTGGARQLTVLEVDRPFIIEEYDGSESVRYRDKTDWIIPQENAAEDADGNIGIFECTT